MAHVVACEGYEVSLVRTGAEATIGNLMNDLFAISAKGSGVISKVKKDLVVIEYDDPNLPDDHVFVGRTYGTVTGKTIPHDIVTDMVVGQRVFEGYIVAWNIGFFARDMLEEGGVVWKRGIPATIALVDGPETIEDSCRISPALASKLTMSTSGMKEITVGFSQAVRNLVSVGDVVEEGSVLCYLEDNVTAGSDLFDEFSLSSLDSLAAKSPKSEKEGTVNKIEILYNGDIDDATDELKELIMQYDSERLKAARKYKDGRVTSGEASDLPIDTAIIRVYVDSKNDAADGDKIVVGHQLKSVIGSVLVGENKTDQGKDIDVYFAHMGVNDRIVMAIIFNGQLSVLQRLNNERAVQNVRDLLETF